jgi:hypothetical protein
LPSRLIRWRPYWVFEGSWFRRARGVGVSKQWVVCDEGEEGREEGMSVWKKERGCVFVKCREVK